MSLDDYTLVVTDAVNEWFDCLVHGKPKPRHRMPRGTVAAPPAAQPSKPSKPNRAAVKRPAVARVANASPPAVCASPSSDGAPADDAASFAISWPDVGGNPSPYDDDACMSIHKRLW